jgi:hypothetical protein
MLLLAQDSDLGKPVAEHTYYLQIEKKTKGGAPDEKATSNYWTKATDRFYVIADTRQMERDAKGSVHLPPFVYRQISKPIPYKQVGRAPEGLGDFHYIIGPTSAGTSELSYPAYDVSPKNNVLEYLVATTLEETEVRVVNKKPVWRTQTHVVFGSRFVGITSNEDYDPVSEKRIAISPATQTGQ